MRRGGRITTSKRDAVEKAAKTKRNLTDSYLECLFKILDLFFELLV